MAAGAELRDSHKYPPKRHARVAAASAAQAPVEETSASYGAMASQLDVVHSGSMASLGSLAVLLVVLMYASGRVTQ